MGVNCERLSYLLAIVVIRWWCFDLYRLSDGDGDGYDDTKDDVDGLDDTEDEDDGDGYDDAEDGDDDV